VLQKYNGHLIDHGFGFISGLTVLKQGPLSGIWMNHGHHMYNPIKLTKNLNRQLLTTERNWSAEIPKQPAMPFVVQLPFTRNLIIQGIVPNPVYQPSTGF
jgi:hypothetical protein